MPGTAEHRAPARERIVDAAVRRFAADGVLGATLEDIRHDAGVSIGAVYHHFADKEALAAAAWLDALAGYQAGLLEALRAEPAARAGIVAGVEHHLAWCAANRERAAFLLAGRPPAAEAGARELNRAFFAEVQAWWRGHVHYGALRDLDLQLAYAVWLGPSQEYCRQWPADDGWRVPAAAARVLADAAWAAVRDPGRDE